MLRFQLRWFSIVLLTLLIAGCPLLNIGNNTFTSADLSNDRFVGDGPVAAGAENDGATDGGGGVPRVVVEPDVIRRNGALLYILNQFRGLSIVDLNSDALLVQVPISGIPRDLYFVDNTAYVLVGNGRSVDVAGDAIEITTASRLIAVDVTEPSVASIQSEISLTGDLVDSRQVGEILYAVTADYGYGYYGEVDGGRSADSTSGTTTVTSVNLSAPTALATVDSLEFSGTGHVVHVNNEAAFIATNNWNANSTSIVYLDISDPSGTIREVGTMAVRGYIADAFKMDAWNGALRVVSSEWQGTNQVFVSTFDLADPTLTRLAERRIEGAEGESLFATRFDGPRAYVVTFLVVDPLFVLDLSDPVNPVVLGALEVPGYSTHIEARGDRLIALGVDTDNGRQITMSIFDVSTAGAPTLLDRVNFGGDWSWSNAYGDVKSLTILDDAIIVPFSGWNGGNGQGFDRLQFIAYTGDTLDLRGTVDLQGSILRSFEYDRRFYGVTTEQLARIDGTTLDTLAVEATVTLAENLVDYLPVSSELSIELISPSNGDQLVIRTVDGGGGTRGELRVDSGYYQNAWLYDDTLVVVGIVWSEQGGYRVNLIDLSQPDAPVLAATVPVKVDPYYAYYGFDIYSDVGFPEDGIAAKDIIGYPYYYGAAEDAAFLVGDTLVLRCFASRFDRVIGTANAYQGLALVNLKTATWTKTIGLGAESIVSLNARADRLYLSTKKSAGNSLFNPKAAYYIQEIDILNDREGTPANVPGAFVDYDGESDLLTLLDHQWGLNGSLTTSLETVRWNGDGPVNVADSLVLPAGSYGHRATDSRVYVEQYNEGGQLYQVSVSASGALSLGKALQYGSYYGSLIAVAGDHAFVNIGGSAIAHYVFSGGNGMLESYVEVAGYPTTVRTTGDIAFFPAGYFGLIAVPY